MFRTVLFIFLCYFSSAISSDTYSHTFVFLLYHHLSLLLLHYLHLFRFSLESFVHACDKTRQNGFASPLFVFFFFAIFKLAGWRTRATIARGSLWAPNDLEALPLYTPGLSSSRGKGVRFLVSILQEFLYFLMILGRFSICESMFAPNIAFSFRS